MGPIEQGGDFALPLASPIDQGASAPLGTRAHLERQLTLSAPKSFLLVYGVSNGYTSPMKKDSGLRIRVERELRDQFLALCRERDRPAAQVIREFMREYVARHKPSNDLGARSKEPTTERAHE